MAAPIPPIVLANLRSGLNVFEPPIGIPDDMCTVAENVEFVRSLLGERRRGCVAISLPTSITSNTDLDAVTWGFRHLPTGDPGDAEAWILAQSLDASDYVLTRRNQAGWTTISPTDPILVTNYRGHSVRAESLDGHLFMAYDSAQPRLHVYDGTTLRRTGLAEPAAPLVVATGAAGAYADVRYVRVRYIEKSGDTILRRSEPSETTAFTPDGTKTGIVISKPAAISEGETHWEVEISLDDANYYIAATVVVGTGTYTDTTAAADGYADGDLSDDIGFYTLLPSARFIVADADRLVLLGNRDDDAEDSTVIWTPTSAFPGAGSYERYIVDPLGEITSSKKLDPLVGGGFTGAALGPFGYIFAFKESRIYKLVRQDNVNNAYEAINITTRIGAVKGSVVVATDIKGKPSIYFIDRSLGPMRISSEGLEWCGYDIQGVWTSSIADSQVPCFGEYYADNKQVHYWIAKDGATYPNSKIIIHTNLTRQGDQGVRGGWVTVPTNDRIAQAHCCFMMSQNIDTTDARSAVLVPFIGKQTWAVDGVDQRNLVQRCDTGATDALVNAGDEDAYYYGRVRAKPYLLATLLGKYEVSAAAILGQAASGASVTIRLRNYTTGKVVPRVIDLTPSPNNEAEVYRALDQLGIDDAVAVEVEFGDLDDTEFPTGQWALDRIECKTSPGETA